MTTEHFVANDTYLLTDNESEIYFFIHLKVSVFDWIDSNTLQLLRKGNHVENSFVFNIVQYLKFCSQ